jgi:hypothetical protein
MSVAKSAKKGIFLATVFALALIVSVLSAPTAQAQNTQVTLEGSITSTGTIPGIIVGDKYSMVIYYNPGQGPTFTNGSEVASYSFFTLSAVVDDKGGNQTFGVASDDTISMGSVPGENVFATSAAGTGFVLIDTIGTAFKTDALPTALNLRDFDTAFVVFGPSNTGAAQGNITSIRVVDTAGVIPAFISAGLPDPNGKVPAANVVDGSGVNNLDISFPLMLLTHGNSYVFTVALQDIDFSGTCQASYTLTQIQLNKTVTLDSGKDATFSCNPGSIWFWDFTGKPIPDFPGPATLTGTVTYGATKANVVSTVVIN